MKLDIDVWGLRALTLTRVEHSRRAQHAPHEKSERCTQADCRANATLQAH